MTITQELKQAVIAQLLSNPSIMLLMNFVLLQTGNLNQSMEHQIGKMLPNEYEQDELNLEIVYPLALQSVKDECKLVINDIQ